MLHTCWPVRLVLRFNATVVQCRAAAFAFGLATTLALLGVISSAVGKAYGQIGEGLPIGEHPGLLRERQVSCPLQLPYRHHMVPSSRLACLQSQAGPPMAVLAAHKWLQHPHAAPLLILMAGTDWSTLELRSSLLHPGA